MTWYRNGEAWLDRVVLDIGFGIAQYDGKRQVIRRYSRPASGLITDDCLSRAEPFVAPALGPKKQAVKSRLTRLFGNCV